jgi:hypothetical protein
MIGPVAVAFALVAFFFFYDVWMHGGVTVFKRRSVLRSGTAAPARVVSADMQVNKSIKGWNGSASAYSIVYEVLPPGAPPFRAKGVEVMTLQEDNANLRAALRVAMDGTHPTVQVKFDPQSHLVVLVRVDAKKWQQQHDAAMREAREALQRLGRD